MTHMTLIIRHALGILLACTLLFLSCIRSDEPGSPKEYVRVGDALPRLSLTLMDGRRVDNATWEGRSLVLVLFSIDCPDCQRELPQVERFYRMMSGRADVLTLGISRGGGSDAVSGYWERNGLTFPCSPQEDRRVYDLFASSVVPRVYVVSPQGRVTHMYDDTDMPSAEVLLQCVGE